MILEPAMETLSRDDLEQLQIERLQTTLNRVYRNVAFYRKQFDTHRIIPDNVASLSDLANLPFTTKADLNQAYPYDMFAVPLKDIVRIHSTSGTTGRALVVGYTRNDIRHWSTLVARLLTSAGVTEHDFIQIAYHYSLFTGGLGFHYGAEHLGASVVPSSENSDLSKQLTLMKDFKITALASTPNYALKLARVMQEMNIHPDRLHLKRAVLGAEPWSEKQRQEIESRLHIDAYDNYGISEVMGPGMAGECREKNGLHINEDHFITTLTKEGFPLIRYRTGDLAALYERSCPCGRTTLRMSRIAGRTDNLIIFKGSKLMPEQIGDLLLSVQGLTPHYQIILETKNLVEEMEVKVEISENLPGFDEIRKLEAMKSDIAKTIKHHLNILPRISLVEPNSLKPLPGQKEKRVIDNRSN